MSQQDAQPRGNSSQDRPYLDPGKRHDFVYILDCVRGNPNGDPDADNLPRMDFETGHGRISDVAIKRRLRDYVSLYASMEADKSRKDELGIFIANRGVLNEQIREAHAELGHPVGKPVERTVRDASVLQELQALDTDGTLPDGFSLRAVTENRLAFTGETSPTERKQALDELVTERGLSNKTRRLMDSIGEEAGKPETSREHTDAARDWMRRHKYDVRMMGGVMQTGLNAGQSRGPLQIVSARSVDPVAVVDQTITRQSVAREEDREKISTMGNKPMIEYGLFVGYGFYNPHDARESGVTEADLELMWRALKYMYEWDHSAARGHMTMQKVYCFTHESAMGNAQAQKLFDRVKVQAREGMEIPRCYSDYEVKVDDERLPRGITLTEIIEGID